MNRIKLYNPGQLVFGQDSVAQMVEDILNQGLNRLFVLTVPPVLERISPVLNFLEHEGISVKYNIEIKAEPSFTDFENILAEATVFNADSIAGIGGGSIMDVAKLVAATLYTDLHIESLAGGGKIKERNTHLICIPTTSGTGSEVSPNAILTDNRNNSKTAFISQYLVPDRAYIDPSLTLSLPPDITAFTGIDALTHCIEAYTNRFAHPMIDVLALEGIRLISANLSNAFIRGDDLELRSRLSLGSMYGGMCLGPVNTAGVHALAYPLGCEFKVAHGLANALMLTKVMEFNLPSNADRYADIAQALGIPCKKSDLNTAVRGIERIKELMSDCNIPSHLSDLGIPADAIGSLARSAMSVQRLLRNNPKEISLNDAESIYKAAF